MQKTLSIFFVVLLTSVSNLSFAANEKESLVENLNTTVSEIVQPNVMATTKLQSYNIDTEKISISGISSGAFMAHQMSVAFSKTFQGAASIAGGIYWCSQGNSQKAQTECMNTTDKINPQVQIEKARDFAAQGEIDPLENLAKHKVYIFASPKDTIIKPPSSDKLYEFVKTFTAENQIKYEKTIETGHGFPTLNFGALCNIGYLPWLLKCNFDLAGEILKTYLPMTEPRGPTVDKNLLTYDQTEFGNAQTPLFANGWVYVPDSCQKGEKCALHVALHGCQMNPDFIQNQFALHAGFNEWAESNKVIVLYPQSAKVGQVNPYGCWDWFGFTGENFVTRSGSQMKALKTMIDRVSGVGSVRR